MMSEGWDDCNHLPYLLFEDQTWFGYFPHQGKMQYFNCKKDWRRHSYLWSANCQVQWCLIPEPLEYPLFSTIIYYMTLIRLTENPLLQRCVFQNKQWVVYFDVYKFSVLMLILTWLGHALSIMEMFLETPPPTRAV